jgi:DNA-binding response OmpR family regulator
MVVRKVKILATILLVEDAVDLAAVIIRELSAEGHKVEHVIDGISAVESHSRLNPDIIILDWMLPKMDGLAVLRQIRQSSPTPILMLTARGEETDRVVGLEVGADDYLTKPFSMRELIARIHALLRRVELIHQMLSADRATNTNEDEVLGYGTLTLLVSSHQAMLGGEPIDLSRTEFALLVLLLRNPGRVFSRSYLLETVWNESYIGGDRSVDNVVLRLRKKLGDVGDAVETVWGVGYRLHVG